MTQVWPIIEGFEVCDRCHQQHLTHWRNKYSCSAHRTQRDELGNLIPCQGYRLPGLTICKVHGGSSKRSQAKARAAAAEVAQRQAIERAAKVFGVPRQIDPAEGLIEAYWRSAGIVSQLEAMVSKLSVDELSWGVITETETTEVGPATIDPETGEVEREATTERRTTKGARKPALVKYFDEERDRFERLGLEIVKLGLEARRDAYVRGQVDVFVTIVERLGLTDDQRRQLAMALRALNSGQSLAIGRAE